MTMSLLFVQRLQSMPCRSFQRVFARIGGACLLGMVLCIPLANAEEPTTVSTSPVKTGVLSTGKSAQGSLNAKLSEAEHLATRGKTQGAIDAYQALLKEGADFAQLHYNLGTLFLQAGDLGHAVLHFTEALKRDPSLDDARFNLRIALRARADRVSDVSSQGTSLADVGERIPHALLAWLFLSAWVLFVLVGGLSPWLPQARRQFARQVAGLLLGAAVVSGVGLWLRSTADARQQAVVIATDAPARQGPAVDAELSFTAHAGLIGTVVGSQDGFVRLRLQNGLEAWLANHLVEVVR